MPITGHQPADGYDERVLLLPWHLTDHLSDGPSVTLPPGVVSIAG
jgi:hypothetical protein